MFPNGVTDRKVAIEGFEKHNEEVRQIIPADRLLEWQATEGWEPICAALDLPVPDGPFPHRNTTEEWLKRRG